MSVAHPVAELGTASTYFTYSSHKDSNLLKLRIPSVPAASLATQPRLAVQSEFRAAALTWEMP
jgi:hypothetical protein